MSGLTFDMFESAVNQLCSSLPDQLAAVPLLGLGAGLIARIACVVINAIVALGPDALAGFGLHFS